MENKTYHLAWIFELGIEVCPGGQKTKKLMAERNV
jgi:hypothetical protein